MTPMMACVDEPIDISAVLRSVATDEAGAAVLFIGSTRNMAHGKKVIRLEYEAYRPMALAVMREIEGSVRNRWNITGLSILHRLGPVPVGETSVVIAVSSVHRSEGFEACRYTIDELKTRVPIWKKEWYADGSAWIGKEGRPLET